MVRPETGHMIPARASSRYASRLESSTRRSPWVSLRRSRARASTESVIGDMAISSCGDRTVKAEGGEAHTWPVGPGRIRTVICGGEDTSQPKARPVPAPTGCAGFAGRLVRSADLPRAASARLSS